MRNIDPDSLLVGTVNAQDNTWKNRYNNIVPTIKKEGAVIRYSTSKVSVEIAPFDEIILTIIMKFMFTPVWLIKQFYNHSFDIVGNDITVEEILNKWVELGIVWRESDVTGQYLRPTYALFKLFRQDPYPYHNLPFNMLRHTICEQQVVFDIMSGNSEILKYEETMPRISELGFDFKLSGTNVISEKDFRNPSLFKDYSKITDTENKINQGMKDGLKVTPELLDFRLFNIVKKIDNTGVVRNDFSFHIPDLIIPNLRKNGKPQSIAIEVELTNKRFGYEETIKRYKNNNKFGSLYWLVNDEATANYIRMAYEKEGGTGDCKMKILEFIIPSPDF